MIRVLLYVALVFLIAAGFAWLAERPGEVALDWQGYEVRTSLMVAALALGLLIAALAFVGWVTRKVINAPRAFESFLGSRRRDRGYRALSTGIIAVGAGDLVTAERSAREARGHLGDEPLAILLTAQAAQLAGDGEGARKAFEALAARPATKVLGLHGLFIEARRQGEHEAARHFAEAAASAAPKIGWAGSALFEYQSRAGDWQGALDTLSANAQAGIIDRDGAAKLRAVLLTARAMDLEAGDPDEARAAALDAHRLAPDLTPAAVVAGRLLTRAGDVRRASKVLEAAWKVMPHPEVADAYASVRPGDSVRDRLKRMRRLADLRANHPEGAMAVARAAIDARDFAAARAALDGLARAAASERVCLLMAEIEERELGDQGKVRTWLTRALTAPRDPAWVADGRAFARWAPVSPLSGRVGAFEWKVAAGPPPPREAVEIEADLAEAPAMMPQERAPMLIEQARAAEAVAEAEPEERVIEATVAEAPAKIEAAEPAAEPPAGPEEPNPQIIRAPDDPGPTPEEEVDDEPRRRFRLF